MVIVWAVAGFSAWVTRRAVKRPSGPKPIAEQAQGFVYVGAVVLILVGLATLIFGVLRPDSGRAEATAVLGFFGYALYGTVAAVAVAVIHRQTQRAQGASRSAISARSTNVAENGEGPSRSTPLQPLPREPQPPTGPSAPRPDGSDNRAVASPVPGHGPSVDDPD